MTQKQISTDQFDREAGGNRLAPPTNTASSRGVNGVQRWFARLMLRELSITHAASVLIAAFFLSAVLGAVRQVLLNARFGVGMDANAYYAAFRLPDTLFSLIAGGTLSSAMIPVLVQVGREEGEAGRQRLTRMALTTLMAVFTVLVLLGIIFAPLFVTRILAPGFDAETSRLTVLLTRIMLIQPLILAASSVAAAVLNSRSQFALTGFAVAIHNVPVLIGIGISWLIPAVGIYGPTFGVVAGALLQTAITSLGLFQHNFRLRPAWNAHDPHLREVIRLLIPNSLSVGVGYAGGILDTAWASLAPEKAGLPALHNAWMLASLPVTLLGHAIGQSAFPRLAAHAASHDWNKLHRTLILTLAAVLALVIPAMIGLILIGRPAIRVLFEHGRFDSAAGSLTYAVLVPYVVALPAYVCTEVLTRGLIALHDTRTPLITNIVQLGGRALLLAVLTPRIGVLAIPIALASTAIVETLLLSGAMLLKFRRRTPV